MFMIPKWEDRFEIKANKIIILESSQLNHLQSSPPVTKLKPSKSLFHPITVQSNLHVRTQPHIKRQAQPLNPKTPRLLLLPSKPSVFLQIILLRLSELFPLIPIRNLPIIRPFQPSILNAAIRAVIFAVSLYEPSSLSHEKRR